eukprot:6024648-Pyramimonas_sp.AAC.1
MGCHFCFRHTPSTWRQHCWQVPPDDLSGTPSHPGSRTQALDMAHHRRTETRLHTLQSGKSDRILRRSSTPPALRRPRP